MPYFSFNKIFLGPVVIYTWGVFVAMGVLIVYFFALNQSKKKGIEPDIICNLFIWAFFGAAAGSLLFGQGGLSIMGGIFGVIAAGFLYLKSSKNLRLFFPIADLVVLILPVSIAVGRVGCALINDHQGAETSLPWGIVWPDGAIRHPVAEYLIISNLLIFLILRFLQARLKKPGQLFFSFLLLYSFSRFFLDFTRSCDTLLSDPHYWGLSTTQWLSLLIIFVMLMVSKFFKRSEPGNEIPCQEQIH